MNNENTTDRKKVTLQVELVVPVTLDEQSVKVDLVTATLNERLFRLFGETTGVEKVVVQDIEYLDK